MMTKFFKKISVFALILLSILLFLFFSVSFVVKRKFGEFRADASVQTLVLGDSHIKLGVDPAVFKYSLNVAQLSEPYLFTYAKLRYLLNANPDIRIVYIGFSYHNLSSIFDDVMQADNSINVVPQYFFILPRETQWLLVKDNMFHAGIWSSALRTGIESVFTLKQNPAIGGFENMFEGGHLADSTIKKRIDFHFYKGGRLRPYSEENLKYLKKIILLCRESGVNLFFLKTPLHPHYKMRVPENYLQKFDQLVQNEHLQLIDFKELKLSDSDFEQDGDHVAKPGAFKVSSFLNHYQK